MSACASCFAGGRISLVSDGSVGTNMLARLEAHMEKYLEVAVDTRVCELGKQDNLEHYQKSIDICRLKDDVLLIALVTPEKDDLHLKLFKESKSAVVNAGAMASKKEKTYLWRLQRQVVRAAAFLAGLEPAPIPHCATYGYRTLKGLDQMGRTLCPPSKDEFSAKARVLGLKSAGN